MLFDLLPDGIVQKLTDLLEYDATPFKAYQLLKYTLECRWGKICVLHIR